MTEPRRQRVMLWTGPKHSGKTAALGHLIGEAQARGLVVGGIVAPSRYEDGELRGFDIADVQTGRRAVLSCCKSQMNTAWRFEFTPKGLQLGRRALAPESLKWVDLVIVDEFGPLELERHGWRKEVDTLISLGAHAILLVVRDRLVEQVRNLYGVPDPLVFDAIKANSVDAVLSQLELRS